MNSLALAIGIAVLAFCAGVVGLKLHKWLPERLAPDRAKEMIGAMTGLLGLLLALVLGTLVGSAYTLYATQKSELETLAARTLQLNSALEAFGPDAQPGRDGLRKAIKQSFDKIWGGETADLTNMSVKSAVAGSKLLDQFLLSLNPKTDAQKQVLATASLAAGQIAQTSRPRNGVSLAASETGQRRMGRKASAFTSNRMRGFAASRSPTGSAAQNAWKQFEMTFKRNYHRASPFEITNNKKPGDLDAEYKPLTEDEWNTWIAWTEKEFVPRNRRIAEILKNRADLIEGWAGFSESYEQFLLHMQAFESNWRNWEATHQKDKWRLAPNWPQSFEVDVRNTFVCLKQRQAALGSVLRDEEETDQTVVECRHALAERK